MSGFDFTIAGLYILVLRDTTTFTFLFTGQFTNPTIFGVLTIGLAVIS